MKVIVSGLVWLNLDDLTDQNIRNIKSRLIIYPKKTTDIQAKKDPGPIHLYEEDEERGLLGIPRGFYLEQKTLFHEEILDISNGASMQALETKWKAEGPFKEQEDALRVLGNDLEGREWGGVLLKASPGFGKTPVGLEFARRLGRRTLILVHKEFFLNQWKERIEEFLPDARVGIIQQKKCEFEELDKTGEPPDFVVGMIQSLVKGEGKYPSKMYSAFGTIISDEVHRISAPSWSRVIPRFKASWRIGLSATPRRSDRTEDVFFQHISPITYSAKTSSRVPKLRRIFTDFQLRSINRGRYQVSVDRLNSAQILTQVANDDLRTRSIVDDLVNAVKAERKVIVVSERLDHLRKMAKMLGTILFDLDLPFTPVLDFYTGEWFTGEKDGKGKLKKKTRTREELKRAERANVVFATKQIVSEGFDLQALDVLVLATPMGDVEQVVGRVRRWCLPDPVKCRRLCPWRSGKCKGKPTPIVVDVVDHKVRRLNTKWQGRMRLYSRIGAVQRKVEE